MATRGKAAGVTSRIAFPATHGSSRIAEKHRQAREQTALPAPTTRLPGLQKLGCVARLDLTRIAAVAQPGGIGQTWSVVGWIGKDSLQKLGLLGEAVAAVEGSDRASLDALLREARSLFERRNSLVHSCIVAGGRVISSRSEVSEWHTSPDELTALAEQIFTWKEHLSVYRWKKVEPLLQRLTPVEATRT